MTAVATRCLDWYGSVVNVGLVACSATKLPHPAARVVVPLEGLRIGEQLAWYARRAA